MKNKLFFGGLAWATTEAGLRAACEKYGEVEDVSIIQDRATGRSKGFGFVTFATDEGAARALEAMNGMVLDGRTIKVDYPREREYQGDSRGGRETRGFGKRGDRRNDSRRRRY